MVNKKGLIIFLLFLLTFFSVSSWALPPPSDHKINNDSSSVACTIDPSFTLEGRLDLDGFQIKSSELNGNFIHFFRTGNTDGFLKLVDEACLEDTSGLRTFVEETVVDSPDDLRTLAPYSAGYAAVLDQDKGNLLLCDYMDYAQYGNWMRYWFSKRTYCDPLFSIIAGGIILLALIAFLRLRKKGSK
ncbi:MAG: hypothetical protein AABX02_02945 [archaeon]